MTRIFRKLGVTVLVVGTLFCTSNSASAQSVALLGDRAEIVAVYNELSQTAATHRREAYRTLPADMRRDLWLLHIENVMAKHPEINELQRMSSSRS